MDVTSTLAQATVTDLAGAEAWYGNVLGAPPDTRPMEGLIEWHFGPAHGLQVFEEPERAGHSTVVLGVTELNSVPARLDEAGIHHAGVVDGGGGRLLTLTDPDGNRIVLLERAGDGA